MTQGGLEIMEGEGQCWSIDGGHTFERGYLDLVSYMVNAAPQRVNFPLTYGWELIDGEIGESTLGGVKMTVANLYDAQSVFHSPTCVPLSVVLVGGSVV
jgi:hypothetical protein